VGFAEPVLRNADAPRMKRFGICQCWKFGFTKSRWGDGAVVVPLWGCVETQLHSQVGLRTRKNYTGYYPWLYDVGELLSN
jgi:hypothetical protein